MNSSATVSQFQVGLTPDEKKLYSQLFKQLDPENTGIITGDKARTTFEKSGLLPPILGEIWQMADPKNLGFLTQFGFCLAMRLIGYTQHGKHPLAALAQQPGPLPKFADLLFTSAPSGGAMVAQLTNGLFMGTQPLALIPQNTATGQFKPQEPLGAVPPQDVAKFTQLFTKTVGTPQGYLDGAQARDIFIKAKLPTATLGQIWNLVDRTNLGKLNLYGFVIAMYLIQQLLSGQIKQLPPFLPESLWQLVGDPGASRVVSQALVALNNTTLVHGQPQSSPQAPRQPSQASTIGSSATAVEDWVATPHQVQQFNQIFTNLDKNKSGQLLLDQVVLYLVGSKLPQQELAAIWDLADIQNTGVFSRLEFSLAVFLVQKSLNGEKLPNIVPESLLKSLTTYQNQVQHTAPPMQLPPAAPAGGAAAAPAGPSTSTLPPPLNKPKTAMDDLVDIFALPSNSRQASVAPDPADLTHSLTDMPRVRNNLTGSFKPTSSFGQQLMGDQGDSLGAGATAGAAAAGAAAGALGAAALSHSHSAVSPQSSAPQSPLKLANYDALRSIPPPRASTGGERVLSPLSQPPSQTQLAPTNTDLYADADLKELSQATTDVANYQNQIKLLATQTTALHDKRARQQEELARVQQAKREIEAKLGKLRLLYQQEVKQSEELETALAKEREEKEALRLEALIAEAKHHALQQEVAAKQAELEKLKQENKSHTDKMAATNAEITQLERDLELHTLSHTQLTNQANVKKSQLQVVLVKVQELRLKIATIQQEHGDLQKSITDSEQQHAQLEREMAELHQKGQTLTSSHQDLQTKHQQVKARYAQTQTSYNELQQLHRQLQDQHAQLQQQHAQWQQKATEADSQLAQLQQDHTYTQQQIATQRQASSGSGAAVGVAAGVAVGAAAGLAARGLSRESNDTIEQQPHRLEPLVGHGSLVATDYKHDNQDTPVTLPLGSELGYGQGNAGVIGGMVGMPGVPIGVQRTDLLTLLVQNNAPLSVRDDNLDDINDRDVAAHADSEQVRLGGIAVKLDEALEKPTLLGGELFEFVSQEDAKSLPGVEPQTSASAVAGGSRGLAEEEFPPIRELEIDELDSDDDDDGRGDQFDDARSSLPLALRKVLAAGVASPPAVMDDFDSNFENLTVATPEVKEKDMFDDFDNLENADEGAGDEEFPQNDFSFSNEFTEQYGGGRPQSTAQDKDEWEQIFAGFGNAQPGAAGVAGAAAGAAAGGVGVARGAIGSDGLPVDAPAYSESPHMAAPAQLGGQLPDLGPIPQHHTPSGANQGQRKAAEALSLEKEAAVEELVGMGFDHDTSLQALKQLNWDLAEATNYLLDNA